MEFKIEGKLITRENMSHQEFVLKFTELLKSKGIHFAGETKVIKDNDRTHKSLVHK